QLRGEDSGTSGQHDQTSAGRDRGQNLGAGQRIHERQIQGGGAEESRRAQILPPVLGAARVRRGVRPRARGLPAHGPRHGGGQEVPVSGRGGPPVRGRGLPPGGAHRGRGMPPRGAPARGGVPRGGPPRGGAVRGVPSGRGGPPAAPSRGAPAPRARPPAAGPPHRMAHPPPHQHTPTAASEGYEEYGYDESYTDTAYESYDSYYSQPQAEPEYYDYGPRRDRRVVRVV
ncbi:hypothetical protein KUCAC02_011132, partial [Chaenocephalus aceratus]